MNSSVRYDAILFDLDGTLIDSAPSILSSFDAALKMAGVQPLLQLTNSLIGPPLRQTLVNLTGITDDTDLDTLVGYFKDSYDSTGYQATIVYDGVDELLESLAYNKIPMAIATNKRKTPTLKIIEFLGWEAYFRAIGTLDSVTPALPDKAALITVLLDELNIDPATAAYVGDKLEDGFAAEANRMPFIAAGWGYGDWESATIPSGWQVVKSTQELTNSLIHYSGNARNWSGLATFRKERENRPPGS